MQTNQTNYTQMALEIANAAYAMGDADINQDLPHGERGDTLADFVHVELSEISQHCSYEFQETKDESVRVMRSAAQQLLDVADALEKQLQEKKPQSVPVPAPSGLVGMPGHQFSPGDELFNFTDPTTFHDLVLPLRDCDKSSPYYGCDFSVRSYYLIQDQKTEKYHLASDKTLNADRIIFTGTCDEVANAMGAKVELGSLVSHRFAVLFTAENEFSKSNIRLATYITPSIEGLLDSTITDLTGQINLADTFIPEAIELEAVLPASLEGAEHKAPVWF